jgi:hypothetical protein
VASANRELTLLITPTPSRELKALLEEVGLMARVTPSVFVRRLAELSKALAAVTGLLEHVAALLRQLVHVVGWLVLLSGSVSLLLQPHLSPVHLITPGAGMLAVLQGAIKPRRRQAGDPPAVVPDEILNLDPAQPGDASAVDLDNTPVPVEPDGPVAVSSSG